jgi:hypothetical protein
MKGFAPKKRQFCLRIQADVMTFPVYFFVQDEGKIETILRANRTAIAIFAIAQYGTEADGYAENCELFGDEYAEQVFNVQKQIYGQDIICRVRDVKADKPIMNCASREGLIDDANEYNSATAAQELISL